MNLLIILWVFLYSVESLLVKDVSPNDGKGGTSRSKLSSIKYLSLPTEDCKNITSDSEKSEDQLCRAYCKELKKNFFDGECIDGTCHCKFDVTAIVASSAKKTRNTEKKGRGRERKGVKCRNLIRVRGQVGSENHGGCKIHCRLLNSDNKDGRCIDGICQCSKEKIEGKQNTKEEDNTEEEDEEEEEREEEDDDDGKCRNDEECESECKGPNRESRCMNGICRCRIIPPQQEPLEIPAINREVKKCEHRRRSVSNEICRSHCEDFSKDHREGHCVDGVCQCGYAVFEIMETKNEEEKQQKARKVKGRSRGRF